MIQINLLPEEAKKKDPAFKKLDLSGMSLQKMPVLKITAAAFSVLVIIQAMLFAIGIHSRSQLKELSKSYEEILPKKREADALKSQVDTINKKMAAIDQLMAKGFSWANKLNDLSDSMTPGIWLINLSYDERLTEKAVPQKARASGDKAVKPPLKAAAPEKTLSRYLTLSGYASSMGDEGTALVGKYIKSLKDNADFYSDFSDIELGSIRSDKFDDQEVMNFKITCYFKEDAKAQKPASE